MIEIHFIVNPIAGSGQHRFSETYLQDYFEADRYNITIKSSSYKGHAINLTQESISQKADVVVACGGDGTINEVASTLVGTSIPLGIVPIGSGNGLASNLKISRNLQKALYIIKNRQHILIDVGCVNEHYFFSNAGFGFTADVIENYEALQRRTLWGYAKATLKSLSQYSTKSPLQIRINDKTDFVNPFIIFISNSNVMGYNYSLTPKASLQDGKLDIIVVPALKKHNMLLFGACMLIKKPNWFRGAICYQTDKMTLLRKKGSCFESQIDGELVKIGDELLSITIKVKALKVLV